MVFTSVFDMLKIGIGPSSSHTLGPWRACEQFLESLIDKLLIQNVSVVHVDLYGSLALTGKGHGTDIAIILGLSGYDPETIPIHVVSEIPAKVKDSGKLLLNQEMHIEFDNSAIVFNSNQTLKFHPNGMTLSAYDKSNTMLLEETYFSVGGGFVVKEGDAASTQKNSSDSEVPYMFSCGADLIELVQGAEISLGALLLDNEYSLRERWEVDNRLTQLITTMENCIYRGCHTTGILPGGLNVKRRAPELHQKLIKGIADYQDIDEWKSQLQSQSNSFDIVLNWISCFAIAVNEENAAYGRVVTAPTNGAAGVIPAVWMYLRYFKKREKTIGLHNDFLLVASLIGSLFKEGATISAAMGGCQAEIGVSSSMAAGALTYCLGGTVAQVFMAAEIAMEHHLGLTCDPIKGLVQIPCIERNTMGAIKAIMAGNLALVSDPQDAKVSLDAVIKTMWSTAKDMSSKYKETSLGGLATNFSVAVPEC
jgi:L-serine dehydratase